MPKRQAEQLVARAAEDFDAFYEARRTATGEPPPEGSVVVLTFDGKGVVLHREDLREATRRAAEKRRQQREPLSPFRRLQPGEKKRAKRMASRTCRARIPARMLQNAAPIAARMATLVPMIVFDGTASEPHPSAPPDPYAVEPEACGGRHPDAAPAGRACTVRATRCGRWRPRPQRWGRNWLSHRPLCPTRFRTETVRLDAPPPPVVASAAWIRVGEWEGNREALGLSGRRSGSRPSRTARRRLGKP